MKPNLDISIFQIDLAYKDKSKNYNTIDLLAEKINETDVILLPEMFNTSFIPSDIALAEEMSGTTVNWMKSLSKRKNASVAGTLMIKENNLYYNRLVWVSKNGDIYTYDKCHLFSLAKEDRTLTKGNNKIIIKENGWSICPLICYDIRFPNLYRELAQAGAEILAVPAAFTKTTGSAHWHILNRSRAIENIAFVIAPCAIGNIPGGGECYGHSLIINPWGEIIKDGGEKRGIITASLDLKAVKEFRKQLPSLTHDNKFKIEEF